MGLLDQMIAKAAPAPATPDAAPAQSEIDRILALPRRPPPSDSEQQTMAREMTALLRRDNPRCACAALRPEVVARGGNPCITELRPVQGWYLKEALETGGIFGMVNVGGGKCLARGSVYFDAMAGVRRDISEYVGSVAVSSLKPDGLGVAEGTCLTSGEKPCWRVTLADGSYLDASYDHRVLTSKGWVWAANLKPGDLVAVPSTAPESTNPTTATDDEVSLLGLLLADGGCNGAALRFTNATPAVIDEFQVASITVCGGFSEDRSKTNAREFTVRASKAFRDRWSLYGLAKDKRAHPATWGLPTRQVALLVNRIWACDGYVNKGKGYEITLASEGLIDDLKFFLLRLGVRSRKRERSVTCDGGKFTAWRLSVTSTEAVKFNAAVGPILGKEAACADLAAHFASTTRNPNVDIVPFGPEEFEIAAGEMGWAGRVGPRPAGVKTEARKMLGVTAGQYVSRTKFAEFCSKYGYRGQFASYLWEGIAWERVERTLPIGTLPVYDLSVPETHNFVANGMVVHNTGIDILVTMVVPNCKLAILLIPPQLKSQLMKDYRVWSQHFQVPNLRGGPGPFIPGRPVLEIFPYSQLSQPENAVWLKERAKSMPRGSVITILDEAHNLKSFSATRTGRYMGLFEEFPEVAQFAHSGSAMTRSILDCTHLVGLSLGDGSPMPLDPDEAEHWSLALDPLVGQSAAAAPSLKRLCAPGQTARSGFAQRLIETKGIISTVDARISTRLTFATRRPPPMPGPVLDALQMARSGERPDGDELEDAFRVAECSRQVAAGFYLYWAFPRGESEELIADWRAKRKAWGKELRNRLAHREDFMDSPGLLKEAAERYHRGEAGTAPGWPSVTWPAWAEIADKVQPVTKVEWIDDWLMRDAAEWGRANTGIIWVQNDAVGKAIAKLGGFPFYQGGDEAAEAVEAEQGTRSVVASLKAHGTGRNLQYGFSKMLFVQLPSDGAAMEQAIGRCHRPGQTADTVKVEWYQHVEEYEKSLNSAVEYATFMAMTGPQKLLYGEWL